MNSFAAVTKPLEIMYSNFDFERFFIRYKAEVFPHGEFLQKFCLRNNLPYNLFEKWYKDTRHHIVPVQVEGTPDPLKESSVEKDVLGSPPSFVDIRILVDIRMTNGMHIQQRNVMKMAHEDVMHYVIFLVIMR